MALNQQLLKSVRALVSSEDLAVDYESGLCRFCDAVVESNDEEMIEGHRASCPWAKVRTLVKKAS